MVKRLRRVAGPSWPLLLLKRSYTSLGPRRRRRRRSRRGGSRRRKAGLGGKGGRGGGGVGGRDNNHSGGHRDSSSVGAVSEAVGEMGDPGSEVSGGGGDRGGLCVVLAAAWCSAAAAGRCPGRLGRAGVRGPCGSEQEPAATMAAPGPSSLLLLLRRPTGLLLGREPASLVLEPRRRGVRRGPRLALAACALQPRGGITDPVEPCSWAALCGMVPLSYFGSSSFCRSFSGRGVGSSPCKCAAV